MRKQFYFSFALALLVALFGSAFIPSIRLFAFAPFLALIFMRLALLPSLWIAAATSLLIDLLSSEMHFGAFSLIYCLTTLLTYHQKRHFFADKPLALSLYTALISVVASSLELFFRYALDSPLPLNWMMIATDVFGMSVLDALYAFICFTCPIKIYQYFQRIGGLGRLLFKKNE